MIEKDKRITRSPGDSGWIVQPTQGGVTWYFDHVADAILFLDILDDCKDVLPGAAFLEVQRHRELLNGG